MLICERGQSILQKMLKVYIFIGLLALSNAKHHHDDDEHEHDDDDDHHSQGPNGETRCKFRGHIE